MIDSQRLFKDKEISQKYLTLAKKVLLLSRNNLLANLRYMDIAISRFVLTPLSNGTVGTDGYHLFYSPLYILHSYKNKQNKPTRTYLHCLLHCVFRHMFVNQTIDRNLWDLACDISVENTIIDLNLRSVMITEDQIKITFLKKIKKEISILTAEKIYSWLTSKHNHDEYFKKISVVFSVDDHQFWYISSPKNPSVSNDLDKSDSTGNEKSNLIEDSAESSGVKDGLFSESSNLGTLETDNQAPTKDELGKMWLNISNQVKTAQEMFSHGRGINPGSLTQNLRSVTRERYDYTDFLKKFSTYQEEMKVNDEEFDYIFYTYGLSYYGNMPLIEPLEYKDVKRIREFVIAIDTSGSVTGELVQAFVNKTYNILKSTESFFSKITLHIIQCDEVLQEDKQITNQENFDNYIKNMQIKGAGGTDFRPVFSYVDRLIAEGEFTNLKGLIYFTDGYGTYPERMPNYETAFVFIDDEYTNPSVPPWAIKLVLQREEI